MPAESYSKVGREHLERDAFLYVRQSTARQVVENAESTKRQYALRDRAAALGADEPRRDGKVFVAMGLAGASLAGVGHARPASRIGAWIRPFQ